MDAISLDNFHDDQQQDEGNWKLKEFIDIIYHNIPVTNTVSSSIFDLGYQNFKLFQPTTIKGKIIRVNQGKSEQYAR
jgi:hypothetical protein